MTERDNNARDLYFGLLMRAASALADPNLSGHDRCKLADEIHDAVERFLFDGSEQVTGK